MRRVRSLYDGLPASARAFHERNGGWTITDHLLARLIEETGQVKQTVFWSVPRQAGTQGPQPVVIRRPGQTESSPQGDSPRRVSPVALASMMRSWPDG